MRPRGLWAGGEEQTAQAGNVKRLKGPAGFPLKAGPLASVSPPGMRAREVGRRGGRGSKDSSSGEAEKAFLFTPETKPTGNLPGGPVVRLCAPKAGASGSIPGQGARSHMLQLRAGTAK